MKMMALLDSGANAIYIDKAYAQKMKHPLTLLADPIPVCNIDGTWNAAGSITHCTEIIIQFQEHRERVIAEVTDLGKNQMTYHQYLKVFSKKKSERMPIRKPWDHAIDLTETFKPKKGRLIPLSPEEQKEVSDFIDDQLSKKYIRPSKLEKPH
jgi:hypothetical protein